MQKGKKGGGGSDTQGRKKKKKTKGPTHNIAKDNKKKIERFFKCILIHSSPKYVFAPGLWQGKASWEKWLAPPNPYGYQKACHYHNIHTIFWDVRQTESTTKDQNEKQQRKIKKQKSVPV